MARTDQQAAAESPMWGNAAWSDNIYLINQGERIAVMKLCKGHCRCLAKPKPLKEFIEWYSAYRAEVEGKKK